MYPGRLFFFSLWALWVSTLACKGLSNAGVHSGLSITINGSLGTLREACFDVLSEPVAMVHCLAECRIV